MDAETIRTRIERAWDDIPVIFTRRDVLRATRMSKDAGSTVRCVLDRWVEEGRLYKALHIPNHLGRHPTAWSKTPVAQRETMLMSKVQNVLPSLPLRWTIDQLVHALKMSRRMRPTIQSIIDHLEKYSIVMRSTDCSQAGTKKTVLWTANPKLVAEEIKFKCDKLAAESYQARLDRMFQPWDPLRSV